MNATENHKKYVSEVLVARFNNLTDAHHAHQMLTDLGYSRDAVTVVELSHIEPNLRHPQDTLQQAIIRILKFSAIPISIIFIASFALKSIFSPVYIGTMILVWITLTAGGAVACYFIGKAICMLIDAGVTDWGFEAMKQGKMLINVRLRYPIEQILKYSRRQRGKVLISVKLRTPGDASEIRQMWRAVAPNRPDLWIIQAKE